MKPLFPALLACICIPALFSSCAVSNVSEDQRKADIAYSKEAETACFVKLKDGSLKNYQTLELVTGVFTTPHLLADGKTNIYADGIIAYQNQDHYAISQSTFATGRRTVAAVETLPGFAVRIAKGKVNVYCKKFYNGHHAVNEYFVQSGNDGEIFAFSETKMKEIVKDYPEAADLFTGKKFNGANVKKSQATSSSATVDAITRNK